MNALIFAYFLTFLLHQVIHSEYVCAETELNKIKPYPFKFTDDFGLSYEVHLVPRKSRVFENVSFWTLNSSGIFQRGFLGKENVICEDINMEASLIPIHDAQYYSTCNATHFSGVFGPWVSQQIVATIERYKQEMPNSRFRRSLPETETVQTLTHIIQTNNNFGYKYAFNGIKNLSLTDNSSVHWERLDVKIAVVIDYALYSILYKDHEYINKYMNVFWSSVEIKYRKITEIPINLKVTAVIAVEEYNVLAYTDQTKYDNIENSIDVDRALDNFGEIKKYLNETDLDYNLIITLTGSLGLGSESVNADEYSRVNGITWRKGICNSSENGVIVEDDGNFFGINNAIHEIAHSLGVRHDGFEGKTEEEINYSSCNNAQEGFHTIMYPTSNSFPRDEYVWSKCSKNFFTQLKSDKDMKCIGQPSSPDNQESIISLGLFRSIKNACE